ncbi:MAG TPA: zinc-dependent metalloprotease [Frankiaceae bacterium]|nr:zinc-dependent metalloprotease [Frankiaceae bacterium]
MSSELPFGFGSGGEGAGGRGSGPDPQGSPFGSGAPFFAELEKLLSWQGGPVNWELARQVAVRAAGEGDPPVSGAEADRVREAVRLAEVWLDPVTAFPAAAVGAQAWTRVRWVESTLPVWRTLCDPVAGRVVEAMRGGLSSGLAELGKMPELAAQLPPGLDPGQLASAAGPLLGMMNQLGGLLFGAQVGQAIGTLAREVVSSTEVGLPLGPAGQAALLPANVASFGRGLAVPADEVRIYVALREAASTRLFGHVPWLRAHLLATVEEYARGISIDPEAIGRAMAGVDPTRMDPDSLQQALGEGVFGEATSPEQKAVLARLETALALVEGWVDEVVDAAAAGHLPAAPALRETVRRRRATGGPAEQTFAALVGLELRPRRLREAAALWRALLEARGVEGRDAVWAHPDLLPDGDDLTDPAAYVKGGGVPGHPMAEIEALGGDAPREDDQGD